MTKRRYLKSWLVISILFISAMLNAIIFNSIIKNSNPKLPANLNLSKLNRFNFISTNNIPFIPQLISPANGSIYTSNIVKFDWADVGNPSDNIFYEFLMDNDTNFSSPEAARFAINTWSNSTMNDDPYTLFIAHFNNTLKSEEGEDPVVGLFPIYTSGKFGEGINISTASIGILAYNTTNNLNKKEGTIEFWINLYQNITDIASYSWIFDYNISSIYNNRLSIAYSPPSNIIYVNSKVNGTDYYLVPGRKTIWNTGEWHHLCLTWGNEMARLYFDGIEEAASTYFPIGDGPGDTYYLGSYYGGGAWINATFDEVRISSIQRLPLWNSENSKVNVSYFGTPIQRYPIWNLNNSEYTHLFEQDGTYYWKVRSNNASGPSEWSATRIIIINRNLNQKYPVNITILDVDGDLVSTANLSYKEITLNKLMGIDANYVLELNKSGFKWYNEGSEIDVYKFFGNKSINSFRTRLWTSEESANSLENATLTAKIAQNNSMMPYLTIFLSDDWSDINKQPLPTMFQNLTFEDRLKAITNYTRNVTSYFKDQGINIEFYEIGNEIDFGICGVYANMTTDPNYNLTWMRENIWYNSSRIINASIEGVLQVDPSAQFMLHIAISDPAYALAFYTAMKDFKVPYSIIGLSYHPVAAGDASENGFKETIKILSTSGLPGSNNIIIPETSYSSKYNGSNYFNWNTSITEFPLSEPGQKEWVKQQLEWLYQHSNILGMNYWSPELYHPIWEGFSWFNSTGYSKSVVEAYPEFYNLRNTSLIGWDYSNGQGRVYFDAYRGNLTLTIQIGNHTEEFNITISPFRNNTFILRLSINVTREQDNSQLLLLAAVAIEQPGIPDYILFSLIAAIGVILVILIIIRSKKSKKSITKKDKLYFPPGH